MRVRKSKLVSGEDFWLEFLCKLSLLTDEMLAVAETAVNVFCKRPLSNERSTPSDILLRSSEPCVDSFAALGSPSWARGKERVGEDENCNRENKE